MYLRGLFVLLLISLAATAQASNDLLRNLLDAPVDPVVTDQFRCVIDIDGQVVSPQGKPVVGAVVCLLESGWNRQLVESGYPEAIPAVPPVANRGVLARTVTDADGRYTFKGVKAPNSELMNSRVWAGFVVAGKEEVGIGWVPLPRKSDRQRSEVDLEIRLLKCMDIGGVYQAPDGQPVGGATLSLMKLDVLKPTFQLDMAVNNLELSYSSLLPQCETNEKGEFKFEHVPEGWAAIVLAAQTDAFTSSLVAISTDPNLQAGERGEHVGYLEPKMLLSSNCTVVAEQGVHLHGQVKDESNQPLAEVRVTTGPSDPGVLTNALGKFELRLPSRLVKEDTTGQYKMCDLSVLPPVSTSLLPQTINLVVFNGEQLIYRNQTPTKSDEIILSAGVLVEGRVEDTDGNPVSSVTIERLRAQLAEPMPYVQTISQSDGRFQMVLPAGKHTLVYYSRSPGLELPTYIRSTFNPRANKAKPVGIEIDVSDGRPKTVAPIRVTRVKPVEVIVVMPDGRPARGADVVLWHHKQANVTGPVFIEPGYEPDDREVSLHALTNEQGKVELLPIGKLSNTTTVEAKLTVEGITYSRKFDLFYATKQAPPVIKLVQPPMVEGRVMRDGKPQARAEVVVSYTEQVSANTNRMSAGGHVVQTDADGWYRLPGEVGRMYSASILRAPGIEVPTDNMSVRTATGPATWVDQATLRVPTIELATYNETIEGVVVDAQDQPVKGAVVSFAEEYQIKSQWWIGHRQSSQFTTDDEGKFSLKRVAPGKHQLQVIVGQQPKITHKDFSVSAGDKSIKLRL